MLGWPRFGVSGCFTGGYELLFASGGPKCTRGCRVVAFGLVCFLRRVDFVDISWENREVWLLEFQWDSIVILEVICHYFLMWLFALSMFLGEACCSGYCCSASFGVLLTGFVFS